MKRILLITLLTAVLVVAAAVPYWFGVEAQRIYNAQMDALDASNKIQVVENRFQRGWLRSQAETTLKVEGIDTTLLARHTIEHGPIPAGDPVKYIVSLNPLQALIRTQVFAKPATGPVGDTPVGVLLTTVNMDSTTNTRVRLPEATAQLDGSGELAWRPVSGHVDFTPVDASWRGLLTSDGADWRYGDAVVEVGQLKLGFVSFPGSTGLALGSSDLEAASLVTRLSDAAGELTAHQLKISSAASEGSQTVSYTLSGKVAAAEFAKLRISDAHWNLEAKDLDRDSLTRLSSLEVGSALPLNDLVGSITRRHAKLDSMVGFATESGPFSASANLALGADGDPANPLMMLGALKGRLDLDMPPAVVELAALSVLKEDRKRQGAPPLTEEQEQHLRATEVPGIIQGWVDNGLLTRDQDRYRFNMTIDQGAVHLNGKPFDFKSLLR